MGYEKEWWFPERADTKEYCQRLREDYPEEAHMDDETLMEHFNESRRYSVTWDHIGDAYAEYEKLADAFLELLYRIRSLEE